MRAVRRAGPASTPGVGPRFRGAVQPGRCVVAYWNSRVGWRGGQPWI